jgi:hypothetical protein
METLADNIITLLFLGFLIAGILDLIVRPDSEEVRQFNRLIEMFFRRD